jgi:hypothetical protein
LGVCTPPTLHTKLIVIGLAVVFTVLGVITARSTINQVVSAASHASIGAVSTTKMLCLLVGYLVLFLGTLALLTIPLQQLLVGGALTGVIVGTAAQQPLGNLFAGLVLLIARPVAVGQRIGIHSGALGSKPRSLVRHCDPSPSQVEAPDHASSAVFQAGHASRHDEKSSRDAACSACAPSNHECPADRQRGGWMSAGRGSPEPSQFPSHSCSFVGVRLLSRVFSGADEGRWRI